MRELIDMFWIIYKTVDLYLIGYMCFIVLCVPFYNKYTQYSYEYFIEIVI